MCDAPGCDILSTNGETNNRMSTTAADHSLIRSDPQSVRLIR